MKTLIITLLCVFTCGVAAAQNSDSLVVVYKSNLSEFERQLLDFQGMSHMNVEFSKSVKPRKLTELRKIVYRDGVLAEDDNMLITRMPDGEELTFTMQDSAFRFAFIAQSVSTDRVKVGLQIQSGPNSGATMPAREIDLKIGGRGILVETFDKELGWVQEAAAPTITYPANAEVPLIAFSIWVDIADMEEWQSFCNLRDAGVHPRKWGELGLKNYIYYTVKFK